MNEKQDFLDILGRIKYFLENDKIETAKTYTANEYYILKNDLFAKNK